MALKRKRFYFIPFIILGILLVMAGIVMLLWNTILPELFPVRRISYVQALGLLILCKILFGSFRPGPPVGFRRGGPPWKNKLMNLSPEERERFREEWQRHNPHVSKKENP